MKSLFGKKLATLLANINGNIFENIVGYITAARLKNVLTDTVSVIEEINKRELKIARWNISSNAVLANMVAGATVNETVLYEDDIILLSGQATTSENGLWLIQAGASPVRPGFFSDTETQQSFIWVANLKAGQSERLFITEVNNGSITVTSYFENALADGGSYRGVLMIASQPSIPAKGIVYFTAGEKGTYVNAGNIVVTSEIAVIKYNSVGGWSVVNIPIQFPDISVKANLNSPVFTGTPTTPTAAPGTNTQQIANAAFVQAAIAAINLGALLNNAALTGISTAPTAAPGTNTQQLANTAFVQAAIAALVNSSPAALDTLNELAAALGNDANFATTMTNALAGKQANMLVNLSTKVVSGGSSLNDQISPGHYEFGDGVLNKPCDYGYLQVWRESPQLVGQIAQNIFTGEIYTRVLVNGTGWLAWRKVWDSGNMNVEGSEVLSGNDIDWSGKPIRTKTLTAATTLTFSNLIVNKTITLKITGVFTLILPASVTTISGEYDGTKNNLIQLLCINSAIPEVWCTISQPKA